MLGLTYEDYCRLYDAMPTLTYTDPYRWYGVHVGWVVYGVLYADSLYGF